MPLSRHDWALNLIENASDISTSPSSVLAARSCFSSMRSVYFSCALGTQAVVRARQTFGMLHS